LGDEEILLLDIGSHDEVYWKGWLMDRLFLSATVEGDRSFGSQKPGFLPVLKTQIQYFPKKPGFFGCSASTSGSLNADRPLLLFSRKSDRN
jgi:hypothetical protein